MRKCEFFKMKNLREGKETWPFTAAVVPAVALWVQPENGRASMGGW